MEGLLEMTFRPSQHNVRFRSVFGSISGGFWDHFREVFGHTSGSEGVLKLSSFSVAHFDGFQVHILGAQRRPCWLHFRAFGGDRIKYPPFLCCDAVFLLCWLPKMVPKSTQWSHLGSEGVHLGLQHAGAMVEAP